MEIHNQLIPQDILNLVFSYLPIEDAAALSRTCKVFKKTFESMWKTYAERDFSSFQANAPYKEFYQKRYQLEKNVLSSSRRDRVGLIPIVFAYPKSLTFSDKIIFFINQTLFVLNLPQRTPDKSNVIQKIPLFPPPAYISNISYAGKDHFLLEGARGTSIYCASTMSKICSFNKILRLREFHYPFFAYLCCDGIYVLNAETLDEIRLHPCKEDILSLKIVYPHLIILKKYQVVIYDLTTQKKCFDHTDDKIDIKTRVLISKNHIAISSKLSSEILTYNFVQGTFTIFQKDPRSYFCLSDVSICFIKNQAFHIVDLNSSKTIHEIESYGENIRFCHLERLHSLIIIENNRLIKIIDLSQKTMKVIARSIPEPFFIKKQGPFLFIEAEQPRKLLIINIKNHKHSEAKLHEDESLITVAQDYSIYTQRRDFYSQIFKLSINRISFEKSERFSSLKRVFKLIRTRPLSH